MGKGIYPPFGFGKHVRMAAHELFAHFIENIGNSKIPVLLEHIAYHRGVQHHIAEFFFYVG